MIAETEEEIEKGDYWRAFAIPIGVGLGLSFVSLLMLTTPQSKICQCWFSFSWLLSFIWVTWSFGRRCRFCSLFEQTHRATPL